MRRMELLCDAQCKLGESPVWRDDTLYWVDISARHLHQWCAGVHQRFELDRTVSAIAPAVEGFVAVADGGFGELKIDGNSARFNSLIEVLESDAAMRMNDGALDRQGRFWAGSMGLPPDPQNPAGRLYCFDGTDSHSPVSGLLIQNGLAFAPDGTAMFYSDSHPGIGTVWRCDYDPERGIPSNPAVFCTQADIGGRPDGAAVDTDGCYWIAASDGARIVRLTPAGDLDDIVEVPTRNPTNICFGGPDRRTMFATSLTSKSPDAHSGAVFAIEGPWQGVPEIPWPGKPAPH